MFEVLSTWSITSSGINAIGDLGGPPRPLPPRAGKRLLLIDPEAPRWSRRSPLDSLRRGENPPPGDGSPDTYAPLSGESPSPCHESPEPAVPPRQRPHPDTCPGVGWPPPRYNRPG